MELVRFIYGQIAEFAGYATGRLVLGVLSAGRVRVQRPIVDAAEAYPWHGIRRDPDGVLSVSAETAELIGVLTWVLAAISAVLILGRL
jgi:hypothetical protein